MTPRRLDVEGFLPFQEPVTLDFTGFEAAAVSGPNGAGKSTLCSDTLLTTLYGRCRYKGEELINSLSERCRLELAFEHRGAEYTVRRTLLRGKSPKLELWQGGTELTERLTSSTQDKLQEILGFSDTLLLTTALATQGQMAYFVGLTPADRAKVLIEMLGLAVWEHKRQTAQRWLSANKDLQDRMVTIESEQAALQEQHTVNTALLQRCEVDQLLLSGRRQDLQEEIASLTHTVSASQGAYTEVTARQTTIAARRRTLEQTLTGLPDPGPLDKQLEDLEAQLADRRGAGQHARERANTYRDLAGEYRRLAHIGRGLGKLQTDTLDTVPCRSHDALFRTCPLLINARSIRTQQAEFLAATFPGATRAFSSYLAELEESATGHERDLHEWVRHERDIELAATQLQTEHDRVLHVRAAAAEKASLQAEYDRLSVEEHELQAKLAGLSAYAADDATLTELQRQAVAVAVQENTVSGEIYRLRAWCTIAEGRLATLTKEWEEATARNAQAGHYRTLAQAYQDIPSLLFHETVPWLETRANEVLAVIAPGRTLELQVFRDTKAGTQQRTLDLLCHGPEGSFPFDLLSGSEQFRLALALRLALARILADAYDTPLEFFVMDEGLGCLDDANCSIIKQTLRAVAPLFRLFLVITHVAEMKDLFPVELAVSRTPPYVSRLTHTVGIA